MAVNYDEKILSAIGKPSKNLKKDDGSTIIPNVTGNFVVDPNKVIVDSYYDGIPTIKDRYVNQEDLVMYANITARMAPDNHILEGGNGESDIVVSLGQIGVNFLNPYKQAPRDDKSGKIIFGDEKFKNKFTTEWSDYFTSNAEQGTFFDPETFGISSIDVTHNASLTPIIKAEFIDVQGRTLLERGNDPENPYNIFYRFPYPLFTLTIKGYFGKAIEYPLVMTKTSTTFDSTTGNYVIRAEFLSKTFSLYNNFSMAYAYVAPYLYKKEGTDNTFLGRKLLRALYDKQNKEYAKIYGVDSDEYKKREILNAPTLIDLSRAQSSLNVEELQFGEVLNELNKSRQKALGIISELESAYKQTEITQLKEWNKYLRLDSTDTKLKKYFLTEDYINKLLSNDWPDLKERTFKNASSPFTPYNIYGDEYRKAIQSIKSLSDDGDILNITKSIIDEVKDSGELPEGYKKALSIRTVENIEDLLIEELILHEYTSVRNIDDLNLIYFTNKYIGVINKIIIKNLSEIYTTDESQLIDNLTFTLKDKLGYIPNMLNVVRILMNNMQVFLSILNLVALNAYRQIERDDNRRINQQTFGEYGVRDDSDSKIFYPFPNYYEKVLDTTLDGDKEFTWKKTYPGDDKNIGWFEVQLIEEIFRAISHIASLPKNKADNSPIDEAEFIEKILSQPTTSELKKLVLTSSLLVMNNLDYYNDSQTQTETISEFIEKILLYSANSFIHKNGDLSKINNITKKLAENEFALLNKKQYNKDRADVGKFYNGIKSRVAELGNKKGYDVFMETFVGGTDISNQIISANQSTIGKIKTLVDTQNYNPGTLLTLYDELLLNITTRGVNSEKYSRLYKYNTLEYASRKNVNTVTPVRALFFNGLGKHDTYSPDTTLKSVSDDVQSYLKTTTEPYTGPGYMIYESIGDYIKKDYPVFTLSEKVSTNTTTIDSLTSTLKTDKLFNNKTFFSEEQFMDNVLMLDDSKKIKDNTTYSKIRI